jgi:hypothetical protein
MPNCGSYVYNESLANDGCVSMGLGMLGFLLIAGAAFLFLVVLPAVGLYSALQQHYTNQRRIARALEARAKQEAKE